MPKTSNLSGGLDPFEEGQVEAAVDDEDAEGQPEDRGPDVTDAFTLLDLKNRQAGAEMVKINLRITQTTSILQLPLSALPTLYFNLLLC